MIVLGIFAMNTELYSQTVASSTVTIYPEGGSLYTVSDFGTERFYENEGYSSRYYFWTEWNGVENKIWFHNLKSVDFYGNPWTAEKEYHECNLRKATVTLKDGTVLDDVTFIFSNDPMKVYSGLSVLGVWTPSPEDMTKIDKIDFSSWRPAGN